MLIWSMAALRAYPIDSLFGVVSRMGTIRTFCERGFRLIPLLIAYFPVAPSGFRISTYPNLEIYRNGKLISRIESMLAYPSARNFLV